MPTAKPFVARPRSRPPTPSPTPADEHVDGALDAGLHVRRQRQVEQLERRLVDREAQALVEGVGQHHREEERRRHRQHRPEQERHRQQQDRDPHAEPAQRRPRGGELDDERRDAHAEVEGAEQAGQAIGVAGVVFAGDQAELEAGPLGDDGDEEHHQRQGREVARPADDAERGRQPQRRTASLARRRHLPLGPGEVDHDRREEDQDGQDQQQVDRADPPRQLAGEQAAADGPGAGPGADHAEQAPGLPGVEHRAGERPGLHRHDDPEAVHPDVEDAGQAVALEPERPPEQQDVQAEEHQRAGDDRPGPDPLGDEAVDRQADGQHQRHRDDRRRRGCRRRTRPGTGRCEWAWRAGTRRPPGRRRGTSGRPRAPRRASRRARSRPPPGAAASSRV